MALDELAVFTGNDVQDMIGELEDSAGWAVIRVRAGEVIEDGFVTEEAADEYIDDNDYDTSRVESRKQGLSDQEDLRELEKLRAVDTEARRVFGDAWRAGGLELCTADYFTGDWALRQARDNEGLDVSSWPLTLVDWGRAASERRDSSYYEIRAGGTVYYGSAA